MTDQEHTGIPDWEEAREALLLWGRTELAAGRATTAARYFFDAIQRELEAGVGRAETYVWLGRAFASSGEAVGAAVAFEVASSLAPQDGLATVAPLEEAARLSRQGKPGCGALLLREVARRRFPGNNAERQVFLASAAYLDGDIDRAAEHLQYASEWAPEDIDLLTSRVDLLVRRGRYQEALPLLRRIADRAEGTARDAYRLGTVYERLGDVAAARDAYHLAVVRSSVFSPAWRRLLYLDLRSHRYRAAVRSALTLFRLGGQRQRRQNRDRNGESRGGVL